MDSLIQLVTFLGAGFLGVFLLRILKPNIKKENTEVVLKVDALEKKNEKLESAIVENKEAVQQKVNALEQEKKKDLSANDLADFFDKRK